MSLTAESQPGGESLWARRAARRARQRSVTRTVVVGRTPLRIAVRPGTGSGPPLLLANGIGASLETFEPFLAALDPAIEVIRFDVPGVGGSPLPARPYRFGTLAHLLAGLLDHLGHEQADILGISWGGALAQQFALSERTPLPPGGAGRHRDRRAHGAGQSVGAGHAGHAAPVPGPRTTPGRSPASSTAAAHGRMPTRVLSVLHRWTRVGPSRGYLYQLAAGAGWTSLPLLPLLRQPTLVLAGDDDPIIPQVNGRILASLIPHARLHTYPGGHVELVLRPDLLAPLISEFLTETEPGPPSAGR